MNGGVWIVWASVREFERGKVFAVINRDEWARADPLCPLFVLAGAWPDHDEWMFGSAWHGGNSKKKSLVLFMYSLIPKNSLERY